MSVLTKSAPTSGARARKSTGGFNNPGWIEGGREERVEKIRVIGDGIRTRIREWLTETTSRELRAHGKNTGNRLSRKNPTSSAIKGNKSARRAAALFSREGTKRILELRSGQGGDILFFAGQNFRVCAVDNSAGGSGGIRRKSRDPGLARPIETVDCDVREGLPFEERSFDA